MSESRQRTSPRPVKLATMLPEFEFCYRAACSRDRRFDGWFVIAVTTTGIYCRPSCPAITPKREHARFYPSAAAAQQHGFRACKRCRPDASPGSPEWRERTDLVARAMRLIADGVVDRGGVVALARRLGYSERHLHRQLVAEVGAGPLALARAQRAHTARTLIETTSMPLTQVAFAAGFASVRQFNTTVRQVYASTPTELRRSAGNGAGDTSEMLTLRLAYREPLRAVELLRFLAARAVPGVEEVIEGAYRRSVRLPRGPGIIELVPANGHIRAKLRLDDVRDLPVAVQGCRRLLDLDADPVAVTDALGDDPVLGALVRRRAGLRVPGAIDGSELAVRAVAGQQISVAGARTLLGRLTRELGTPLSQPCGAVTHLFPEPAALAEACDLPLPGARGRTVRTLAAALAAGTLVLDQGADRHETRRRLLDLPGVGPWTAASIALRVLGDPDAFPATDLGLRRALARLGHPGDVPSVTRLAERWRPWRAYAAMHLWTTQP